MNILVIFRIAFRALARNKMRSALTMLGIVIGVSAVIAMVSIGQGAQASVQEQIANVGTNLLFVGAGSQNVGGVRSGTGATNSNRLTVEDIEAIRREIPTVAMASPTVNTRAQLVFGNQNWNTQVQGVNEQFPQIKKWDVASGEFFTEADVRTAARVIVLGQTVADNFVDDLCNGSCHRNYFEGLDCITVLQKSRGRNPACAAMSGRRPPPGISGRPRCARRLRGR